MPRVVGRAGLMPGRGEDIGAVLQRQALRRQRQQLQPANLIVMQRPELCPHHIEEGLH